jgi:hypothetical protein
LATALADREAPGFTALVEWGYAVDMHKRVQRTVCEVLLYIREPHLERLNLEHLQTVVARHPSRAGSYCIVAFSRVLAGMGIIPEALEVDHPFPDKKLSPGLTIGVPDEWARFCSAGTTEPPVPSQQEKELLFSPQHRSMAGPGASEHQSPPRHWQTTETACAASSRVHSAGEVISRDEPRHVKNQGRGLAPSTRAGRLSILRTFFRDLQEWDLIPRKFDPVLSIVTPKSLIALIGPNPRPIADDIEAKLVWAGLNLTANDLPRRGPGQRGNSRPHAYPIEMCRALAMVWLFPGLRKNFLACAPWLHTLAEERCHRAGYRRDATS